MFFPMAVVAAILPGLYALNRWDMNAPGPWWGLRGLAVLEGLVLDQTGLSGLGHAAEASAYRAVALQPPLYAWLEAVCQALSPGRDPLATVLPSYAAGALVVVLAYLHGRLWMGRGVGLVAAVLTGFNRELLVAMQQAGPATLGLAGLATALLCYAQHRVAAADARHAIWGLLGGLALGVSLLSVGFHGLVAVPVVLVHLAILGPEPMARRPRRWWRAFLGSPGLWAGAGAVLLALAVAGPWYAMMASRHDGSFWLALLAPPSSRTGPMPGLLPALLGLAPAVLPLALLGLARGVRKVLTAEEEDAETIGVAFWIAWLAVAVILRAFWPSGPRPALTLALLLPLNLLAAQAGYELQSRVIPARNLIWLAPLTALSVAWWLSADLRTALADLMAGHRPDALTLLKLHLGLDLIILLAVATRQLDHWARHRDPRRRLILAGYLLAVLAVTAGSGLREVGFRHAETTELLNLRNAIIRRQRVRPFTLLAVVGPDFEPTATLDVPPTGRLRFLLRTTLPRLVPLDLNRVDELLALPVSPTSSRLVLLVGANQELPYAIQAQLGLEAIHASPTGVLEAFATNVTPGRRPRR
jgi:4-amino-4-deoxy-L-arabinose transferase-like glycosyltransferase